MTGFYRPTVTRLMTDWVARVDELFAMDAEARGLSLEARQMIRRERSVPSINILCGELRGLQRERFPAGALGRTVNYTMTLWPKLMKFLEHPELELSNNLAENSMRGVRARAAARQKRG